MKKAKNIRNIDTLAREIYRLKLEAKNIEEKLDHNFEHLQQNCYSMTMNSFFHKKRKTGEEKNSFFDSLCKSEVFNTAVHKVTDHVATRTSEGIENLIDKIFHTKKHES